MLWPSHHLQLGAVLPHLPACLPAHCSSVFATVRTLARDAAIPMWQQVSYRHMWDSLLYSRQLDQSLTEA